MSELDEYAKEQWHAVEQGVTYLEDSKTPFILMVTDPRDLESSLFHAFITPADVLFAIQQLASTFSFPIDFMPAQLYLQRKDDEG